MSVLRYDFPSMQADRAARDLAGGLRAWLEPRTVRYYPSRGVTYESHLAPPAHLVGLRIAALDALLEPGESAPVVVVSAVAMSEKVPDPAMRPRGFELRVGELMDLDETAIDLVAAGYERVDQVEDRGQGGSAEGGDRPGRQPDAVCREQQGRRRGPHVDIRPRVGR